MFRVKLRQFRDLADSHLRIIIWQRELDIAAQLYSFLPNKPRINSDRPPRNTLAAFEWNHHQLSETGEHQR